MADGDRSERELVNIFACNESKVPKMFHGLTGEGEWAVMRAPASGGATDRELPDVLAGRGKMRYAIEAKSASNGNYVYIDKREVTDLNWFAARMGAVALIGVRFDRTPWAFFAPDDLHRTPEGNYRVTEADLDHALTIDDL